MLPQKQLNELSLFKLDEDLAEKHNLAAKYPELVKQLRAELTRMNEQNNASATTQPTTEPN